MTEEQRRLMLHCHLLVWVYGCNDFSSFRALLDKTPQKYNKLARFLEQVIFNQVATLADVNLTLHGHDFNEYNDVTASSRHSAASRPTPDPLVVKAKGGSLNLHQRHVFPVMVSTAATSTTSPSPA